MSEDSGDNSDYDNQRYSDDENRGHVDENEDNDEFPNNGEEKSNQENDKTSRNGEDEDGFGQYAEEDGVSFLDHQVNDAIQKRREEKERARAAGDLAFSDNVDEKLGEDFEDSQWVPPTIEVAWEYRLAKLYRGGMAKASKVSLTKATDIGLGVPLYFTFVKIITYAAMFMTLLSIPSLLFSYYGDKISDEDKDPFGLFKYSIGNIGHNTKSKTVEFTLQDVANILAACEFLQIIVCLIAFVRIYRAHSKMKIRSENRTCSITDYSIMVENVPPDVTMEELIEHFSGLYPLDKADWKGRPGVEGAEPLKHCTNTGYTAHKGTWVAEATIFTKIGSMIRSFKNKQKLMDNLLRCRARMKMYKEDTCHASGPNPGKFRKAEYDMISAGSTIDQLTTKSLKEARKNLTETNKYSQKLHDNASKLPGSVPAEALVAFVVFNYAESMARCVEDYRHYSSYPFKLLMPKKMMLRGHRIKVVQGPEPDEIMWENLEISTSKKFLHRVFSGLVAFCLILIGFAFILQAARYKAKFDEDVPNLDFCDSEIPALYARSYDFPSGAILMRPDEKKDDSGATRADYDLECSQITRGSFYAVFTTDGSLNRPIGNYSGATCPVEQCPNPDLGGIFCPCVTTTSKEVCQTLHCYNGGDSQCTKFSAGTIGGCYCYQELLRLFASSFLGMMSDLMSQDDACASFFANYSIAMGLSLAASLCTVAINVFLKKSMKYLAKQEFHDTVDEEHGATIMKVFLATYCNMAFVALAAYGLWKNKPAIVSTAQVFDGDYADFTPQWYAVVGSYLVTTFILQMFGPMGMGLLKYYILYPCKMCRAHPKINARSSHKYAMQADVNALELGGTFDTTVSNAQLLALFFFAMTYAPGLPLMMPLLLIAFALYFKVDKMLLLKFYEKPPKMGDAVMRVVLALLPWAMVIRLGVACWMYSNSEIFPYTRLNIKAVPKAPMFDTDRLDIQYNNWVDHHAGEDILFFNTGHRIMRGTVFPLFCLMAFIAILTILLKVMRHSPIFYLFKILKWLKNHLKASKRHSGEGKKKYAFELASSGDPLRAEMAPYTGDYFQFLNSEFEKSKRLVRCLGFIKKFVAPDLTEEELQQGWRVSYNGPYKVKMCQWLKTTRIAGVGRPAGSVQRTYEMISCHGCWSYQLHRIPHYKKIIMAIKDGMESIAHDLDLEKGGAGHKAGNHMSILAAYEQRHMDKQAVIVEKKKKQQEIWTNPAAGGAKKSKIQPMSDEEAFSAIEDGMTTPPQATRKKQQQGMDESSSSEDSD